MVFKLAFPVCIGFQAFQEGHDSPACFKCLAKQEPIALAELPINQTGPCDYNWIHWQWGWPLQCRSGQMLATPPKSSDSTHQSIEIIEQWWSMCTMTYDDQMLRHLRRWFRLMALCFQVSQIPHTCSLSLLSKKTHCALFWVSCSDSISFWGPGTSLDPCQCHSNSILVYYINM